MIALGFTAVGSPRTAPAFTRSWEEETNPSEQGSEQRLFTTNETGSEPQNTATIFVGFASLVQPLSGPLALVGGANFGVAYDTNATVGMGWAHINLNTGAILNISNTAGSVPISQGASYHGCWAHSVNQALAGQAVASSMPLQMLNAPMDVLVAELEELRDLPEGWDGEGAATPTSDAVDDAISFVRSVGNLASRLEPAPDVDGSILLEIDGGGTGSLRFRGNRTIVYAIRGVAPGIVEFDGRTVPEKISEAFDAAL